MEKLDSTAQELALTVHFVLRGARNHVAYALVEGDNLSAVGRWVNTMPIRQQFRVTPVQPVREVIAMGRAMMERQSQH